MEFLATDIAALIAGKVMGDSQVKIHQVCGIEDGKPGGLSFLGEEKLLPFLADNEASAVIISEKLVPNQEVKPTLIVVEDARLAFGKLLQFYEEQMKQRKNGVEEFAKIDASVTLDESVYIGSFTYVAQGVKIGKNTEIHPQVFVGEGTEIGENCVLYPGVKIYPNTKIGDGVIIHSGSVIGSDGFGYNANKEGVFEKVPQIGNVVIHDDVEIGANCTIDRAVMGSTIIGKGVKIDNLVHLAHNVQIGEHTAFAAQVGVAGSSKIGKHVQMGGQVGIAGHIEIKDFVKIMAQSGVGQTIEERQIMFGSPAIPARQFKKAHVVFKNLPELSNRLDKLEDKVTSNG